MMSQHNILKRLTILASTLVIGLSSSNAQQISPADQEYFEAKIRPILVDYCYDCHGDGATKGSLDLSSKAGALAGGSSGPAVVPNDPGTSIMIKRIKDLGDPMPPAGKDAVPDALIAELENWIRRGAPDPRSGKSAGVIKTQQDMEKAKNHWGFKPVSNPEIPSEDLVYNGKLKGWIKNPIDAYVLRKLEEKEMVPSLPADKWSLLRRIYFDLIGLPPSHEDVQRFTSGQESYEQVIDRLLASPQYGERWGRHWLDVARYADTTGGDNRRGQLSRYIYAHTYRDWVINSLNEDKPYNQFLIEQIASDHPKGRSSHSDQAGLGFLTLGPRVAGGDEIIDDRIDVITRGVMGLSVYCARCHDHKFDPVPTADYYSLYGVFRSSREPAEEDKPILIPGIGHPKADNKTTAVKAYNSNPDYAKFLAEKNKLEKDHEQFRLKEEYERKKESREKADTYMYWSHMFTKAELRISDNRGQFERAIEEMQKNRGIKVDREKRDQLRLKAEIGETWQRYLSRKREDDRVFGPWKVYGNVTTNRLGAFMRADLVKAQKKLAPMLDQDPKKKGRKINPIVANAFKTPPRTMLEVAKRYKALFNVSSEQWMYVNQVYTAKKNEALRQKKEPLGPPKNMEDAQKRFDVKFDEQFGKGYAKNMEEIRRVMFDRGHPGHYRFDDLKRRDRGLEREENERFISKIESLKINHPGSPPRAMVLNDAQPRDEAIHIKGNARQKGKVVPRQFLEILSGEDRQPFKIGSGRLELAKAIAADDNPLTSRVIVNRIWSHHFGKGIVSSLNEFGLRAMDPSHPELLDYLAWYLVENKWSMKKLHKHIVMSNTYQQTSDDNPRYSIKDPDNIYYYKMDRRRLDFESFRDGLLHVSGKLDLTMGGKPLALTGTTNYRRTVYGMVDRGNLNEMFKTFDFPDPNSTAGQRFTSTVSQQALFMMNSPMVADLANRMINQRNFQNISNDRSRINTLYNMIYQRDPEPIETKLGERFLQAQKIAAAAALDTSDKTVWSNGFGSWRKIDDKNKAYGVTYKQFSKTDGKVWRGNDGLMKLTATGGHPGAHPDFSAVIRRWIAPMDTTVNVSGRLEHNLDDDAEIVYDEQLEKLDPKLRDWYNKNAWDGVTGIIIWSRAQNPQNPRERLGKELGRWDVRRNARQANANNIKVKAGDCIDFIVTSRSMMDYKLRSSIPAKFKLKPVQAQQDNFTWNPTISINTDIAEAMEKKAGSMVVSKWTASDEFEGATRKVKPLNPWEKYTQVLLLSNEAAHVD